MNKIVLRIAGLFVMISLFFIFQYQNQAPISDTAECNSIGNPAFVYCSEIMGYEYELVSFPDGGQDGVCKMPDGELCAQWDFYAGTCGQAHSWCAKQSGKLELRQDGKDPYSKEYAVCLDAQGRNLGPVSSLIGQKVSDLLQPMPFPESDEIVSDPFSTDERNKPKSPINFDWRNYLGVNWVTPVKNQASCGSCWAFSAVGLAEAQQNIISNDPSVDMDLSEQYLVSDCFQYGNCTEGIDVYALEYIRDEGIPDEACYPYIAEDSLCSDRCKNFRSRLVFVPNVHSATNYNQVQYTQDEIKKYLSNYGPVTVALAISSSIIGGYWDGDIYRCSNDIPDGGLPGLNHSVLAVGYNDVGGYWIIKNSWGSTWNGDGYFKLGYNECNVMNGQISWTKSRLPVEDELPD